MSLKVRTYQSSLHDFRPHIPTPILKAVANRTCFQYSACKRKTKAGLLNKSQKLGALCHGIKYLFSTFHKVTKNKLRPKIILLLICLPLL